MSALRTLAGWSRFTLDPVKGSRFIATLAPAASPVDAQALLDAVRAEWPNATHHCWAWRLADGRTRCSDDGEPGGSAGRPILAQLEGHEVEDAVVVVSRWFGGTKLGVGGLIRAYGGCAGKALDAAEVREIPRTTVLFVEHDYADSGTVLSVLNTHDLSPAAADYGATVRLTLAVPEGDADVVRGALVDATGGRARVTAPD
jgi:uncharacterized YigZ family protein